MAKMRRFRLHMEDGAEVLDIDSLRDHFSIDSVRGYYHDGRLMEWLTGGDYSKEIDILREIKEDDPELDLKLCQLFDVSYEMLRKKKVILSHTDNMHLENKEIVSPCDKYDTPHRSTLKEDLITKYKYPTTEKFLAELEASSGEKSLSELMDEMNEFGISSSDRKKLFELISITLEGYWTISEFFEKVKERKINATIDDLLEDEEIMQDYRKANLVKEAKKTLYEFEKM